MVTLGSVAGSGVSGDGQIIGVVTSVYNKLAAVVRGLQKVTEGGLVKSSWIDGSEERMWKPSLWIILRRWRSG